jgi:glycosyltransferase involved in cell wall biosynthesis
VGDAGRLAHTGDTDALASVLRAACDDALVDAIGQAARARYLAQYTPEANLPQLEAIYERALS